MAVHWAIDRDWISEPDEVSRVGFGQEGLWYDTGLSARDVLAPVRFRLRDDDGEPYYGGAVTRAWLEDPRDPCYGILAWAAADAGCTDFQVRGDSGEWESIYG